MDKFGFVILHYLAPEMTRRCVDSLLEMPWNLSVAIVDNASPDGSGALLKSLYAGREDVTVISNPSNLGFARGNNAGYDYLAGRGDCRFIVVMNNDVIIRDASFPEKVAAAYSDTGFAVLGPDIVNPGTGVHQSPSHFKAFTVPELEALKARYAGYLDHFYWKRFKWNVKKALSPRAAGKPVPPEKCLGRQEGAVLHGACYVFSEVFVSKREYCFNPSTFMYFEEDILHFECMRDGLKMIYEPGIQVLHLEDVSTGAAFRTEGRKDRFKFNEMLKSIDVLLGLME